MANGLIVLHHDDGKKYSDTIRNDGKTGKVIRCGSIKEAKGIAKKLSGENKTGRITLDITSIDSLVTSLEFDRDSENWIPLQD